MWIHYLLYKLNKLKKCVNSVFETIKDFLEYCSEDMYFTLIMLMFGISVFLLLCVSFVDILF